MFCRTFDSYIDVILCTLLSDVTDGTLESSSEPSQVVLEQTEPVRCVLMRPGHLNVPFVGRLRP